MRTGAFCSLLFHTKNIVAQADAGESTGNRPDRQIIPTSVQDRATVAGRLTRDKHSNKAARQTKNTNKNNVYSIV